MTSSDFSNSPHDLAERLLECLDQMIDQQRTKVFRTAQRLRPNVTEDDVMDPHSIPEIAEHPAFSYEDGILAGLISARTALGRDAEEALGER